MKAAQKGLAKLLARVKGSGCAAFFLGTLLCVLLTACAQHQFADSDEPINGEANGLPPKSQSVPLASDRALMAKAKERMGSANSNSSVLRPGDVGYVPSSLRLRWPTQEPALTAYFGWRKKSRKKERMHDGIDMRAPKNTPILAAADGEVIYVSRKIRFYGKMIVLDHGNGWTTVYAHLNEYRVRVGDRVKQGSVIGLSGRTGRASGPHLHFEVRLAADPLDPLLFLPRLPTNNATFNYEEN